jgi:hypothetical protein
MIFKLRKIDLIFAIFEEDLIPGFAGEHIVDLKGHFALLCLDVFDKLPKAVTADIAMPKIEKVVSD